MNFSALASGTNYVSVRAYDYAGNVSAVATDVFYIVRSIPDTTPPTITDNQTGDNTVRTSDPGAIYDVDFADTGGSNLKNVQYTVYTAAGMTGAQLISWSNIADNINAASYTTNWGVNFSALISGTNYVSVRAYDYAGNVSAVATDVFFIVKSTADITPPTITDNQTGDDTVRSSNNGTYNIDFIDTGGSGLSRFQVRACSTVANCGDIIDWTDVMTGLSGESYTVDWALPSAVWTALPRGVSYISVRVYDGASNQNNVGPLFYVIKYTQQLTAISVTPGIWNQVSVPMKPDSTLLSLLLQTNVFDLYIWDPTAADDPVYYKFRRPTSLKAGQGFWIYPKVGTGIIPLTGTSVMTGAPYDYALGQGWNQIGTPYDMDFAWSGVKFQKGTTTYTLEQAVAAALVARYPFYYAGGEWRMLSDDKLTPGAGYMAYAYDSGVAALYDIASGAARNTSRVVRLLPQFEMKISATGRYSSDPDNLLGLNAVSSDTFDGEDIVEPPNSLGNFRTSLYFRNDGWQRNAGRYAADYKSNTGADAECAVPGAKTCKVWNIDVATNESGTTMTLTWSSLAQYAGRYEITLVDTVTGASVDMIANTRYSYTTSNGAHAFKVKVLMIGDGLKTVTHTLTPGWNLISVPVDPVVTDALTQLAGELKLFNVYQFYDGKLLGVNDQEGVDIQAGLGYWIHVDENTRIEISGAPTSLAAGVRIPLKTGWNLIGNPLEGAIAWDDTVYMTCGGASKMLSDAVAAGWIAGGLYQYGVDGKYQNVTIGSLLEPWRGYCLKVSGDCELEFKSVR